MKRHSSLMVCADSPPFGADVLDAVLAVADAAGIPVVCGDAGAVVEVTIPAALAAALLDAAGGDMTETACSGSWADPLVLAAADDARFAAAERAAVAALEFDGVVAAALEGAVRFRRQM